MSLSLVRRYVNEIRRLPVLSDDEVRSLARSGNRDALVHNNLRLVTKIASTYCRHPDQMADLIQCGNVGLMVAVDKYDPDNDAGAKLTTYAAYWIRAYILKHLIENAFGQIHMMRTAHQRKLYYQLVRTVQHLGEHCTPQDIASHLDIPVDTVIDTMQRISSTEVPIATMVTELPDPAPLHETVMAKRDITDHMRTSLDALRPRLSERELDILDSRMLAETPDTLQVLSDRWEVSRERVRQVEKEIVAKIRQEMADG
jgi:RNA polymerase sigma-32 factor